jgi:TnpA family transposase
MFIKGCYSTLRDNFKIRLEKISMPVNFLTAEKRESYGHYTGKRLPDELSGYFHLDEVDLCYLSKKRGDYSRLGCALQLATVRFLGTFLDDPIDVPMPVVLILAKQLGITDLGCLTAYRKLRRRWVHTVEIRTQYGYRELTDPIAGFRLSRWLYTLCQTGTERPTVLFDRATDWLLAHKVLLPGASILERFIAHVRNRVEIRLWRLLAQGITEAQKVALDGLLSIPTGYRESSLDRLRSGPVRVSGPALVRAILRLQTIRDLGIKLPTPHIPPSRLASLARFANTAKITAIVRLPQARRIATLVAFVHCIEAAAHDDVLEVLEMLLNVIFGTAKKEDKKTRFRSLKDLDQAATVLASACQVLIDTDLSEKELREKVFQKAPLEVLSVALKIVQSLVRPPNDVYFHELQGSYRRVGIFLPTLVKHIRFGATPTGKPIADALNWVRDNITRSKPGHDAPSGVISPAWKPHVLREDDSINFRAYVFCVLDELRRALRRRDVFVTPSWRYADPRAGLLTGAEWETTKPIMCRTLGLLSDPQPVLAALTEELDQTYRAVADRLPGNPAVRFEMVGKKNELILTPLDKLEETPSLLGLREAVRSRIPRVDLPEVLLEIATRTGFTDSFTQITEREVRATELSTSLCAVLLSEACNTGPEPFVRNDTIALNRGRLLWVDQNYVRDETIMAANSILVSAQNRIELAHAWGGGEVASADGMRFVVPVRTVHAGANPKYFGRGRGVTWYNMISNQFTGLNAITVPGTLRDSLVLLGVVLEQQTELQPTKIMTDTGAYSDVVFGLFRLLGYRFSPRLADIGGTRFWRIQSDSDYGPLNDIACHKINTKLIAENWDDLLRLAASLKLGRVPASGIMRTLQVGDRPTRLAQALAEFGRIDKTLYSLNYIDDEDKRRDTLTQLNRGEGRHSVAREVFHGKRGELRQRYREGQEDQLGALGLVTNIIVLWNTIYIDAAIKQLRKEGHPINEDDVSRLSPLIHEHINMLGRYSFSVPESVTRGELRQLRSPDHDI